MISEDWSNDAENTNLITEINYIWKIYYNRSQLFQIALIFQIVTIFDQINAAILRLTEQPIIKLCRLSLMLIKQQKTEKIPHCSWLNNVLLNNFNMLVHTLIHFCSLFGKCS